MAVKHTTGFLPPTVKVPMDVSIGPQATQVVEGIQRKYGLRTTLLRQLARFGDYHCVELELRGKGSRPLQAVWVGLEDYARMGRGREGYDPLADWLREKEQGVVPPQRPPWSRHGWFAKAEHWINFQLDRLGIPLTGSIAQQRALGHGATILRVPTSRGRLYFKAAYAKAPGEVPLTRFLAERWPQQVISLLAWDDERNWMLMPDYALGNRYSAATEDLAMAAASMALIQVQSVELTASLEGLGCEKLGPARLRDFLADPRLADEFPELDGLGLGEGERRELAGLATRLAGLCDELERLGLPETLVHPDFRAANFFIGGQAVRFIDWQNSCIAHPFFGVMELFRDGQPAAFASFERDPVARAYLEPFLALAPEQRLLRGMALAGQLQHAWRLLRWSLEFPWFEPGGVDMVRGQRFVTTLARRMLEERRLADT